MFDPKFYIPVLWTVGIYLGLWLIKNIVIAHLRKISVRTTTHLDDIVLNILSVTRQFFMLGVSLYAGFHLSIFDKKYGIYADRLLILIVAFQIIIWGNEAVRSWIDITVQKKNNDPSVKTSLNFIGLILKFVVISLVFIAALNNLGVNVSTFITGLGVGGVAIALATQNILGDLFSSLSIVMDKPFVVGDAISLGEWTGTVEYIGLKTTRLKSLSGEQIVVSNSDLLSSKIRNYKRMEERRVLFQLGLTYGTKRENLKRVPAIVEEIIKKESNVRFDRAHFIRYGASSLDFEIVYFVLTPDYLEYSNVHQRVLFAIHEAFEANQLDFAYPTQTLFVEQKGRA